MKLNISKTIDENIIGVDISVAELGTSDTDAATVVTIGYVLCSLDESSPFEDGMRKAISFWNFIKYQFS